MPVRFVGDLVYGGLADEPYLQYETFPHPIEDKNRVEITLATGPRGYLDYDVQSQKKSADLRAGRPDAAAWIYPTDVVTALHVFGPTPATTQAYQWLGGDLNRIGWLDHFLRRRL